MLPLEEIKTPFDLPLGKRRIQLAIHAANCAYNWMDCAALGEYSTELRSIWQERGEQWINTIGPILNGTYVLNEKDSAGELYVFGEILDAIEVLYDDWNHQLDH